MIPPLPGYGPGQRDSAMFGYGRHQALLSGWNMSHVTVTGSGVIDGQGLVKDPKLGSSWMSRFQATKKCQPNCKPGQALDFGRPRVWEPMFSQVIRPTKQSFVGGLGPPLRSDVGSTVKQAPACIHR